MNINNSDGTTTLVGTFYANQDEDADNQGESAKEEQQEDIIDQFTITKSK